MAAGQLGLAWSIDPACSFEAPEHTASTPPVPDTSGGADRVVHRVARAAVLPVRDAAAVALLEPRSLVLEWRLLTYPGCWLLAPASRALPHRPLGGSRPGYGLLWCTIGTDWWCCVAVRSHSSWRGRRGGGVGGVRGLGAEAHPHTCPPSANALLLSGGHRGGHVNKNQLWQPTKTTWCARMPTLRRSGTSKLMACGSWARQSQCPSSPCSPASRRVV